LFRNDLTLCSVLLVTACASRSAPKSSPVSVQEVPAAAAEGAAIMNHEGMPEQRISVLRATDDKVAAQDEAVPGVESGQVWEIMDATGPDGMADTLGAATFERNEMADEGTWAVGCTRLRADLMATTPQPAADGLLYPSWEVMPGSLAIASSEAEARQLAATVEGCDAL